MSKRKAHSKQFRFSLGDSEKGEVGFCFSIIARTPGQAVSSAKQYFTQIREEALYLQTQVPLAGVLGAAVYVRPEAITKDHIVDVSPLAL